MSEELCPSVIEGSEDHIHPVICTSNLGHEGDHFNKDIILSWPSPAREEADSEPVDDCDDCTCDGDNLALQVLCRVFDDDPAVVIEEWRAFDKSGWLWWGRALGAFIRGRLLAHPTGPAATGGEPRTLCEYCGHARWEHESEPSYECVSQNGCSCADFIAPVLIEQSTPDESVPLKQDKP